MTKTGSAEALRDYSADDRILYTSAFAAGLGGIGAVAAWLLMEMTGLRTKVSSTSKKSASSTVIRGASARMQATLNSRMSSTLRAEAIFLFGQNMVPVMYREAEVVRQEVHNN